MPGIFSICSRVRTGPFSLVLHVVRPHPGGFCIKGAWKYLAVHPDNVLQAHAVPIDIALSDFLRAFVAGHYYALLKISANVFSVL
jgi:hypothetical protein